MNIYDIPISLITQQYLDYLDLMQELDLDVAGEFLVMAATLIHIKSRMLLPRVEAAAEAGEDEDPRESLVRRLLEHQRYQAAAEQRSVIGLHSIGLVLHPKLLPPQRSTPAMIWTRPCSWTCWALSCRTN